MSSSHDERANKKHSSGALEATPDTTPKLRELIAKWRANSSITYQHDEAASAAFCLCADELEAALGGAAPDTTEGRETTEDMHSSLGSAVPGKS